MLSEILGEFEIGAKDTETPVKVRKLENEGKKEIKLEIGYPRPPLSLFFDKESLDDFIEKLKKLREVL